MMREILSKVFHVECPQEATETEGTPSTFDDLLVARSGDVCSAPETKTQPATENAEKIRLFDRLQYMLKRLQYHSNVVVATDTCWGLFFFKESQEKTDELNGLLAKIRDWEGNQ